VFKTVDKEEAVTINSALSGKRPRAIGYDDSLTTLFQKATLAEFVNSSDPLKFLVSYNVIDSTGEESKKYSLIKFSS